MKRGAVIGIATGAALVAVAAGFAIWAMTRPPAPDAVADSYLRALSEGDFDAIAPLLPDTVDAAGLRSSFEGASQYISEYTYSLDDDGEGLLGVRAQVEIDGDPGVVFFALGREGDAWILGDFLGSLDVTTTVGGSTSTIDSALIGDVLLPAATALLPAVYAVSPSPAGILTGATEVAVTNEQPVDVLLDATLSPDAAPLAQEQLDAYAEGCAMPADAVPANCGIRVPWAADLATLDDIRFRIEQLPTVALSPDGRTFGATGGVIVATATGTTRAGSPGSFTYRAEDWALRGTIRFSGDEMSLRVG